MFDVAKHLSDELVNARDALVQVEVLSESLPSSTYLALLIDARTRLATASAAESAYTDEVNLHRAEVDELLSDSRKEALDAFAEKRVGFYRSLAYMLEGAAENALELLKNDGDSDVAAARAQLETALDARNEMSKKQGPVG